MIRNLWLLLAFVLWASTAAAQQPVISVTPEPTTSRTAVATNTYIYTSAAGKPFQVIFAHIIYTADATVGNRTVVMELVNAAGEVVGDWHTTPYVTASQTRHIEYMPGTFREATFDAEGTVQTPFANGLTVPVGYSLVIRDDSNVSASDTMIIGLQVK